MLMRCNKMCGCLQLAADPDSNVRSGSELLDRLLKVCLLLLFDKYQIQQVLCCLFRNDAFNEL